ncbi:hypothetical protein BGZ83_006945 [Gryganskiella cystojenkinii]|nr:hypothetical protein BGZ83_006945 [Gryganskiella cystojenkinii]
MCTVSVVKDIHDDEYEEEDDEDDDDDGDDDDDDDDDEVEEEEEEECSEWDAIMHIPGGETARVGSTNDAEKTPHFIQEMEHQMLATVSQGMESENGVVLDLSRSYSDVMLDMSNSGDSTDWSDDITILNLSHRNHRNYRDKEEKEEKKNKKKSHISIAAGDELGSEEGEGIESDDEDEHDHFPSNIKHNNDASEGEEEKDGHNHSHHKNKDKQDDDQDNGGHHHRKPNHGHHSQDQNANLGSTGANGPILLCSSRSCLPSLRDSILSKLSVQIHLVMNHLRHRGTLFHGMEDTAPQTKESLIATQEEMVQQLEDRIVKDLRDWVMGVNRKSSSASETKDKKLEVKTALAEDDSENYTVAEMSVESEGLFLGGEDFETEGVISAASSSNGFRMASLSLSLKDADDDDEGHQDAPAAPQKKSKKSRHHERRDDEHGQRQSDSFLTADKVLMREEWSRWIAHWVHHAKLLILSHSLATRTLQDMNQIAISGENVVSTDQRHWSWNLDKALATVMVATEMLCGGPAPMTLLASTRRASAPKVMASSDDAATLKALALTLNAQKCVDVWSPELEIILQHTATKA